MSTWERAIAQDGSLVEFEATVLAQGGMKDVYFCRNRTQVVAFFRDAKPGTPAYNALKERLEKICLTYRPRIFNQAGGDYWKGLFCWPENVVEHKGRLGIVVPVYPAHFFFQFGSKNEDMLQIKGKEKEGKWFASASNRNRFLDPREKGKLPGYLRICLQLSRAIRRMHAAGLAHSDLSYKNVLIDPLSGSASIIDIDGLVVPGLFPPEVAGTPDFIAPEVLQTQHLASSDPNKALPGRPTDLHALAVLIYMYLLCRHPLRGRKVHDMDPVKDEALSMGANALFIEHPSNLSNRPNPREAKASEQPWVEVEKLPMTILGPYLHALFLKAFVDGLHAPNARPSADDWEQALVKTMDLLQPCQNANCEQGWFVFDNRQRPKCPYCGTEFKGVLPILDFYSSRKPGAFSYDNQRLMVYDRQNIYPWHANRNIFPNEKLAPTEKAPVADFQMVEGKWHLINRKLPDMHDLGRKMDVPIGEMTPLEDGGKILLSKSDGGRLITVTLLQI